MPNSAITIQLTARQRELKDNPARTVWNGAATKTGKSVGLGVWTAEGILRGESCALVGPWYQRARTLYETVKSLLQPFIDSGEIRATDGVLRLRHATNGGSLDVYSADNPQSLFGANYHRVVIDEASRCPEAIYAAALTVISATAGKLRLAFNVELGAKNWAVRNFLRVRAMSPEERAAASEDCLTWPCGGDGLVDPALIAAMRSQMPEPLWRALYLAEIPSDDLSLFRNLDQIFTGTELSGPLPGHHYVAGIDLGRKQDFTVPTIIDAGTGAIVASDRFNEISWTLQCARAAALCKLFRCSKVYTDTTGIGDPISEELAKHGLRIEPFVFTQPSRKALLENLILACDNCTITIPATEKFQAYRREMETFEYSLDGMTVRYAAPANCHDDCVMSLALAVHGFRGATQGVLGWIEYLKQCASGARNWVTNAVAATPKAIKDVTLGSGFSLHPPAPARAPAATTAEPEAFDSAHRPVQSNGSKPLCVSCGSGLTLRIGQQWHCNMCSCDFSLDGAILTPPPAEQCCARPLIQRIGGCGDRCANCGKVVGGRPVHAPAGAASRREYLDRSEDRSDWRNLLGPPRRN